MSRLRSRGAQEGVVFTDAELKYLDEQLCETRDEARRITEYFGGGRRFGTDRHMEFCEKIEGLLHRAAESEMAVNPAMRGKYLGAVDTLETSSDDFLLWACAVAALADFDDRPRRKLPDWVAWTIGFGILAFMAYLWFRGVK